MTMRAVHQAKINTNPHLLMTFLDREIDINEELGDGDGEEDSETVAKSSPAAGAAKGSNKNLH